MSDPSDRPSSGRDTTARAAGSKRFAVIGDPIAHSKSPRMHGAAYRALGLPHVYEAVRVAPHELEGIVDAVRRGVFDGLNVTVPHKEGVMAWVDRVHDSATFVGAANTLVRTATHEVEAHNTDATALVVELRSLLDDGASGSLPSATSASSGANVARTAVVLGAGGAARAAVFALSELGVHVIEVRSRRFDEASVARAFEASLTSRSRADLRVSARALRADPAVDADVGIVVQATSVGMAGHDRASDESSAALVGAVAWDRVPDDAVALDVVYAPWVTPFVRRAKERGLRVVDGRGMLARQGARAFELWLGVPAPYDVMRAALDDDG